MVVRYLFLDSHGKSDGVAMNDSLNYEAVATMCRIGYRGCAMDPRIPIVVGVCFIVCEAYVL